MATRSKVNDLENPVIMTVKIRADGTVASIERADGKILTKPTGQMPRKPIEVKGEKLTEIYSYQLLKFGKGPEAQFIWHKWICFWYHCGGINNPNI